MSTSINYRLSLSEQDDWDKIAATILSDSPSDIIRYAIRRAAKSIGDDYASPPNKIAALPSLVKLPYVPTKKNPEHFVPDWEVGEEKKINPYKGWRKIEQGENSTDGYEYITLKEQIKPWRTIVIKNGEEWFNENK